MDTTTEQANTAFNGPNDPCEPLKEKLEEAQKSLSHERQANRDLIARISVLENGLRKIQSVLQGHDS